MDNVSAFESRVDRCLDAFPFETRDAAKKYLYLLDNYFTGKPVNGTGISLTRGNERGFIDWWGTVTWGGRE